MITDLVLLKTLWLTTIDRTIKKRVTLKVEVSFVGVIIMISFWGFCF